MRVVKQSVVIFILICGTLAAFGQSADPSILTLERIFSTREFSSERFGPARWVDEGAGYTTLEPSASIEEAQDIIRYDTQSGERQILAPASKLVPPGQEGALKIENYEWSTDNKWLLVFTNTKRVWRLNTRGDYWAINLDDWKMHKLGGDAEPSTLMFVTFSPDSRKVGYVIKNNLYVEDLASGAITRLTTDGSDTIINGTFDWVYEEEFGLRNGFRWSPDSKWLAYWQLDAEGVGEFYMIDNIDSIYSQIVPVQYPKVGTTNSACRVGVVRADGGEPRWFKVEGEPRDNYIAQMEWAANSDQVIIQHLNRLQNTNRVLMADIRTGNVESIFTDQDEAWVEVVNDWKWLNDGKQFTWVSERDGWRHIYLVSRDGGDVKPVTPEPFDVLQILNIDDKGGWVYSIASPENPTQRYLYRTRLDGSGKTERLTPDDQPGSHSYDVSPDSRWAIHTYSNFDTPPVISLVRLPEHELVRSLADNAELKKKISALKRNPVEFFRVNIGDGVELDAWMMKPHDFNPDKRYPLLFFVYGEPAGQTVLDRWGRSRYLWHTLLTQHGYLVMSVDNRGTPAPRGRAWRKSIYRQIGILASADQAAAAREIISTQRYIDSSRIGIWGWSGGGSMSLNMIFRYPDIYHTAMSVAPVTNQRYYDTIYQERYMGLPEDNQDGFKHGSPITYAHQLKGKLLIVHGTGDDNVHYQSTEAVVNELITHNKPFTMMAYPNRTHAIREGKNTTRHLYELLTRYLTSNLPPGGRESLTSSN